MIAALQNRQGRWRHFLVCAVVFGVTIAVIWWCWGQIIPLPVWHDEAAYLLQARLFASGRWAGSPRPLPEFFDQFHVLVTPVLAAKYPPGHALALTPGVLLGVPMAMPLLLSAGTGVLVYVLARQLSGSAAGMLSWVLWLLAPLNLGSRPSFLSEVTSGAILLLAWWALLQWWKTSRQLFLVLVAGALGWAAITRPLTALAFALPIGGIVLRRLSTRDAWVELIAPLAVGLGVVGLLPVWSLHTTGSIERTPLGMYTRDYLPWDKPGFGLDSSLPRRPISEELKTFSAKYEEQHRVHTIQRLPAIASERLLAFFAGAWGKLVPVLLPLAILGMMGLSWPAGIGVATCALVFVAYLTYAHGADWMVYYIELLPVAAYLPAAGYGELRARMPRAAMVAIAIIAIVLPMAGWRVAVQCREAKVAAANYFREFQARLGELRGSRSLVFVRYKPGHNVDRNLVENEPDLRSARVLVVHDRGSENSRLVCLWPNRVAVLYDEDLERLLPLPRCAAPGYRTVPTETGPRTH